MEEKKIMIHGIVVSKIGSCDTDIGGREGELKIQCVLWERLPANASDVVYPSPRRACRHVGREAKLSN